jgi:hypothetical protein
MFVLNREFGETEARSGLKRARLANDSCITAFERRKLDKKAAILASPQLQSCSLSCFQSVLASSPAGATNQLKNSKNAQKVCFG